MAYRVITKFDRFRLGRLVTNQWHGQRLVTIVPTFTALNRQQQTDAGRTHKV